MTPLEQAQELASYGFNVVPAQPRGKAIALKTWKEFQTRSSEPHLGQWFTGQRAFNWFIICGRISKLAVLDCDSREAVAWWLARIPELRETARVKTASGWHFYFQLAEGDTFESWSASPELEAQGIKFDVRAEGTGVIAPPSIHQTGVQYTWQRDPSEGLLPVPRALRGLAAEVEVDGHKPERGAAFKRSQLAELLAGGPEDPHKGNNWLTAVAGHLARHIPYRDGYEAVLKLVNESLVDPLTDDDFDKLAKSIWMTEVARPEEAGVDNGYLISDGKRLLAPVGLADKDKMAPWSNFDIRCTGIIETDDGERAYSVTIHPAPEASEHGREPINELLEGTILGQPAKLHAWLASKGVNVLSPPGDKYGWPGPRLQRYLESQGAPAAKAVPALGFYPEIGFITHDGVITAAGTRGHEGVMPHPRLKNWAPYRYGFRPEDEAVEVLREVLTFHDEVVCSVFGAWWAASLLKGHPQLGTSLWPYMAIEAPSESGKSRGFFALMVELAGSKAGHGEATLAALRDQLASHRNGIVWIDDLSDPAYIMDTLRQVTSEGVRTKKSIDRTQQESVQMVCPVVLSGESLGEFMSEKAQRDRAIQLDVPSPKRRHSKHDPHRSQWDDVMDLHRRYQMDLSQLAGTIVQLAMRQSEVLTEFRKLRGDAGRFNDKMAILRVGARVLSGMTGDPTHVERVDIWCKAQVDLDQENMLTTIALPRMLIDRSLPETAQGHPPAFYRDEVVWFNETRVAEEWRRMARSPRERALGSEESIRKQRRMLDAEGDGKVFRIGPGRTARYHALPEDLSAAILARTQMGVSEGLKRGETTETKRPKKGHKGN